VKRNFTDDAIEQAVNDKSCRSIAAVIRKLSGNSSSGTAYAHIHRVVSERNLDTTHWLGLKIAFLRKGSLRKPVQPYLRVYTELETKLNTHDIKLRLIASGLKERQCEKCKLREWMGLQIPIALNHINGNNRDFRLNNLEILCPNCHAQTPTFAGKNRRRRPTGRSRFVQNEDSAGSNPVAATNHAGVVNGEWETHLT
jgi:5-methylcytosine-specific restriction endonuclease McrA